MLLIHFLLNNIKNQIKDIINFIIMGNIISKLCNFNIFTTKLNVFGKKKSPSKSYRKLNINLLNTEDKFFDKL